MALVQKKVIVVLSIFCIAAGTAMFFVITKSELADEPFIKPLSVLPDIVFKDLDGNNMSVFSLRGRPVIFHIWSSWCLLCVQGMSDMMVLQKEFGDALVVLEVNRAESFEIVKKYADQFNASSNFLFVLDTDDVLYKEVGGFSMPEIIFVDKDGMIRDHTRGITDIVDMHRRIQDAFAL